MIRTTTVLLVLLACGLVLTARADAPIAGPWKLQLQTALGATQSSYSDNWVGGEAGSLLWAWDMDTKADRQYTANWLWGNALKLAFGQTHSQDKTTKHWAKPQKSADKIRYDGILKLTKGWLVDPYFAGTFESQFLDASDTLKNRYVNPIELTEATGVARTLINIPDKDVLSTRLGVALRQRLTSLTDPADSTHARALHETVKDGGAEWVTDLALGSAKGRYSFNSKFSVFQAVVHSRSGFPPGPKEGKDWQTANVNWDNIFRASITSLIQTSLAWQLLYDKQIAKGGRFKETLALGLSYKFAK
jgi:hypothetical protein